MWLVSGGSDLYAAMPKDVEGIRIGWRSKLTGWKKSHRLLSKFSSLARSTSLPYSIGELNLPVCRRGFFRLCPRVRLSVCLPLCSYIFSLSPGLWLPLLFFLFFRNLPVFYLPLPFSTRPECWFLSHIFQPGLFFLFASPTNHHHHHVLCTCVRRGAFRTHNCGLPSINTRTTLPHTPSSHPLTTCAAKWSVTHTLLIGSRLEGALLRSTTRTLFAFHSIARFSHPPSSLSLSSEIEMKIVLPLKMSKQL